jgi:hypothetical protein
MKYNRMLCWVDEQEKQAIMQSNINKIDILFADNEEMFILEINNYDFHVVSIHKANDNLVKFFPNIRFFILFQNVGEFPFPMEYCSIMLASNVSPNSKRRSLFKANELIDLFEGRDIID